MNNRRRKFSIYCNSFSIVMLGLLLVLDATGQEFNLRLFAAKIFLLVTFCATLVTSVRMPGQMEAAKVNKHSPVANLILTSISLASAGASMILHLSHFGVAKTILFCLLAVLPLIVIAAVLLVQRNSKNQHNDAPPVG